MTKMNKTIVVAGTIQWERRVPVPNGKDPHAPANLKSAELSAQMALRDWVEPQKNPEDLFVVRDSVDDVSVVSECSVCGTEGGPESTTCWHCDGEPEDLPETDDVVAGGQQSTDAASANIAKETKQQVHCGTCKRLLEFDDEVDWGAAILCKACSTALSGTLREP